MCTVLCVTRNSSCTSPCAALHCAVLCCAVLCCAVLCCETTPVTYLCPSILELGILITELAGLVRGRAAEPRQHVGVALFQRQVVDASPMAGHQHMDERVARPGGLCKSIHTQAAAAGCCPLPLLLLRGEP